MISMPMGVGLAVMSEAIFLVLFPKSHEAGPGLLSIMGVASFFVCLVLMENAILQASGKEKLTMVTMITGGVVKIIVNWFLVANRSINIYGAPIGTLVSYFVMAAMNYIFMCSSLDKRPSLLKAFARPAAASLIMGVSAWVVYTLVLRVLGTGSWMKSVLCLGAAVLVAVVVYLFAAISLRTITNEDMKLIPGGEKIGKILRMH